MQRGSLTMRKRTYARELSLQILYQMDITQDSPDSALANFWESYEKPVHAQVKEFAAELIKGVMQNLTLIDDKISQYATNWQLKRMAVVDRNILRLSCYELLFREDIPPKVSINEAVELAKKYSGQEAGKFVNGILDRIKTEENK
jgi:transcription antitermination factor NusB